MEINNIKYSYAGKQKMLLAITSEIVNLESMGIFDISIINNIEEGMMLLPDMLEEYACDCSKSNLMNEINNKILVNDAIIISDFDIDLDMIREKLFPLIKKHGKDIIIINSTPEDIEHRVAIIIPDDIDKHSEEEWLLQKEQIIKELNSVIERQSKSDYKEFNNNKDKDYRNSLFKLFNINELYGDWDLGYDEEFEEDDEIEERYSYCKKNKTLNISTKDNNIIIDDTESSIIINQEHFDFLYDTLTKILNKM